MKKSSYSDYIREMNVQYVNDLYLMLPKCILITITLLDRSEVYCVVGATTDWECLKRAEAFLNELFATSKILQFLDFAPADNNKILFTVSGDRNWEQGFKWGRVFAALMRHAWAWWRGERLDPVDGQNHMIAVAWNAFTLYYHELHKLGEDDRSKLNNKNFEEKSSSLNKEELTEILESMSRE